MIRFSSVNPNLNNPIMNRDITMPTANLPTPIRILTNIPNRSFQIHSTAYTPNSLTIPNIIVLKSSIPISSLIFNF